MANREMRGLGESRPPIRRSIEDRGSKGPRCRWSTDTKGYLGHQHLGTKVLVNPGNQGPGTTKVGRIQDTRDYRGSRLMQIQGIKIPMLATAQEVKAIGDAREQGSKAPATSRGSRCQGSEV